MRGFWSRRSSSARTKHGAGAPVLESLESRSLLDASVPVVYLMQMDKTASEESENIARFGVKRTGSLAQPLTVYYQVSGTATPDADYIGLSGVLTIPAGKKYASLPVLPIDDFIVDPNETVVIKLKAAPTYALNLSDNVSEQMTIKISDEGGLTASKDLSTEPMSLAWNPDGTKLAVGMDDGSIEIIDVRYPGRDVTLE